MKLLRIFGVFYARFGPHDLQKSRKSCRSVHILLGKLGKLSGGRGKSRHIERKGQKRNIIHLSGHDKRASDSYDYNLEDPERKVHSAVEKAHCLIILDLGGFKYSVCRIEFFGLLFFV